MQTIEVPVKGMDCAECTMHVKHALQALPGVSEVEVYLSSEKAVLTADPALVSLPAIRQAVAKAGYSVPDEAAPVEIGAPAPAAPLDFTRKVLTLFGLVFGVVLFVVVAGEWLGLFDAVAQRIPWYVGLAAVLIGGYPVFRNVIRATLNRQVISHTLMTLGVIAAIAVGEWVTAAVVVFFMRVGDYAENATTKRARRAVKDLTALAPQTARVERDGLELQVPVGQVRVGETVIVRPGETIPVDGEVLSGQATLNQAAITGESLPVEAGPGAHVFAATLAQLGALRVRALAVGRDTTFGRVIKLVEEAEGRRANVQRVADRFSAYYLPVVAAIALLTFVVRRDPLATAAVLVVACSCSFALATPIAMLASIGAGARRGLLIKGGKYLEILERADVLLVDKTGTLTLGRPQLAGLAAAPGVTENDLLRLAASAERYSEHPLAEAVRAAARARGLTLLEPQAFSALPGVGIRAQVEGTQVMVGSKRILAKKTSPQPLSWTLKWISSCRLDASTRSRRGAKNTNAASNSPSSEPRDTFQSKAAGSSANDSPSPGPRRWVKTKQMTPILASRRRGRGMRSFDPALLVSADAFEQAGHSLLWVMRDGHLLGVLAAADTIRPEVPAALARVRALGIRHIELLTGDNQRTADTLAAALGIEARANLLPEDKIHIVQSYQAAGRRVIMVGDGVNDAPALAQADIGIAMGAAGSPVAIEAAHIALMRDDWDLVPQVIHIARRTMGVVRANIAFTAVYNLVGLTLAALGILPPVLSAAAQSLPDIGIMANSSRLIKQ